MRLIAVYRILPLDGDYIELCDECGFDGALVDMSEAAASFQTLGDRWAAAFRRSEELLRARPAPDTWCAIEYAQHSTSALGGIEWAAHEFVEGRSPDWSKEPGDLAGEFEHDHHDCGRFAVVPTLDDLSSAARSMAEFATKLAPDEQGRTAEYVSGLVVSTAAVVRHALHDVEHHLLDIRRGFARLRLASA